MNNQAQWAAGLLAFYAVALLVALVWPQKQYDPQRGVAIGLIIFLLFGLLILGTVLAASVHYSWKGVTLTVLTITLLPAISLLGSTIYNFVGKIIEGISK